ncbi:MAG: hypothetical protein LC114_14080, partial [Bryobacterales bacterium]|nr:hypothetical protein [Bryobacterales bacterium]
MRPARWPGADAIGEFLASWEFTRWTGTVTQAVGLLIESAGPMAALGDFCEVETSTGRRIRVQVVGFRDERVLSIPLEETDGIHLGDRIVARPEAARVEVGPHLLGRVLDGFGNFMDLGEPAGASGASEGKYRMAPRQLYDLYRRPVSPLERENIRRPLNTGIRVIDGLLPCGQGQRIGIFGGSGVGKSTLLGAMARHNAADVSVIALIGERNREVREFIENDLGPEGLRRAVLVVAT